MIYSNILLSLLVCTCVWGVSHLKHDLSKLFIVVLPELPQHDAAELREVDVAVLGNLMIMLLVMTVMVMVMVTMMMYYNSGDLVGHVDALLLHDVQAEHHQRRVQVLG